MSKWLIVVVSVQLIGCATARDATRGAGLGLAGLGALTVLLAFAPERCEEDWDEDSPWGNDCEGDAYTEESLETRGALIAGGTAAVLVGGGLVAVSAPPKRPLKRPVIKPLQTNA